MKYGQHETQINYIKTHEKYIKPLQRIYNSRNCKRFKKILSAFNIIYRTNKPHRIKWCQPRKFYYFHWHRLLTSKNSIRVLNSRFFFSNALASLFTSWSSDSNQSLLCDGMYTTNSLLLFSLKNRALLLVLIRTVPVHFRWFWNIACLFSIFILKIRCLPNVALSFSHWRT